MIRKTICVAAMGALLSAAVIQGKQPQSEIDLLDRIREGDTRRIDAMLRTGADPNTRDRTGATPLMHAAAFASLETMRLLLDAGGDVNATNQSGATALMWATHDNAKVRLLLDHNANVNARIPDGPSALITAALRGKTEVMRMLVAAGADVQTGSVLAASRMGLANIIYTTNDPALREFIGAGGIALPNIATMTPQPLANWFLTAAYSWRPQPAANNAALVKALLDAGANPNERTSQLILEASALSRAVQLNDLETIRLLLERGSDPNLKGSRGLTPLMMAAATDRSKAIIRLLLEKGATVAARDEAGRTALDWALLQGQTEESQILRKAGAVQNARPALLPTAVSKPRTARAAIEIALRRLQPAGPAFQEKTAGCISCHHQSLPAVAVKIAADKSVKVDRELARHPTQATLQNWDRRREDLMLGNCRIFGFLGNATYGMLGMAEEGAPPNSVTDAVTSCLSGLQKPDGSWEGGDIRPPLAGRIPIVYTALAVRGLQVYSPPGRREETTARIVRARDFLLKSKPGDTQDEAFKLLGLVWSAAPAPDISSQVKRLLALQRKDGGWGQQVGMKSDAYATGQALYALRAGGTAASSPAYRKAAEYLLHTQLEDGTWYVPSRAIAIQPYRDAGFPHGPDQFISAAATSWAVIGLAHTL